jgi:hypothetical protein
MMIRFMLAHALSITGLLAIVGTTIPVQTTAASAGSPDTANAKVEVALQINGTPLTFSAQGECTFTNAGTIYEKPALARTAMVNSADRSGYVNYANWHVKSSGADMMNLSVLIGNKEHRISTVKVGTQGQLRGSGSSSFAASGAGGVFTIDAIADSGAKISGRITCSAFGKPEDNG